MRGRCRAIMPYAVAISQCMTGVCLSLPCVCRTVAMWVYAIDYYKFIYIISNYEIV